MKDSSKGYSSATVLAASLALLAIGEALPRRDADLPLRVAVGLWPGSEPLLLAREAGRLPPADFSILEASWPSVAYRAFENGAVDAVVLTGEDVARLLAAGRPARVICVMDESRGGDALVVLDGTLSTADLGGRRVGHAPDGPGLHLLHEALGRSGLGIAEVQAVTVLQPDLPRALLAGEVDAVVASEPWVRPLLDQGGKLLFDTGDMKAPPYRMLVVRPEAITEQRDRLVALLESHFEVASSLGATPPDRIPGATMRRQRVDGAAFADSLARLRILDRAENLRLMRQGRTAMEALLGPRPGQGQPDPGSGDPVPPKWWDETILEEAAP
jgi:NitT/TauT family transport system substrate-binding protein